MIFNELSHRLYLLLRDCHNGRDYEPGSKLENDIETALGDYERIELVKEPLPYWAVGVNIGRFLCVGAQLFTRDGTRTGNAHVLGCSLITQRHKIDYLWEVMTESGNRIKLNSVEVNKMFTIGPYLCDPKEVEAKYGQTPKSNLGSSHQEPEFGP